MTVDRKVDAAAGVASGKKHRKESSTDGNKRPDTSTQLRRLLPYFSGTPWAFVLGAFAAALSAVCETGVAWMMVPLVDGGFKKMPFKWLAELPHPPLWAIPVALVVLFAIRGLAGFVVDYSLAWAANRATLRLRSELFARVLDADPGCSSSVRPAA